jgi:hypothetical protein
MNFTTGEGIPGARGLLESALSSGDRAARADALDTGGGRLPLPVNYSTPGMP